MKKYVGMPFFNEFDILDIKLEEYYNAYDGIVICEGAKTQSGIEKPFYFEDNASRYSKYSDKIVHLKINHEEYPEMEPNKWTYDIFQRNYIKNAYDIIGLQDNDWFGIEDCDEIVDTNLMTDLQDDKREVVVYNLPYHVYYLNLRMKARPWRGQVAVRGNKARQHSLQDIIKFRDYAPAQVVHYSKDSIHAGYQFGPDLIYHKYKSCVEPFDKVNGIPVREHFDQIFKEYARPDGQFIFCDNLENKSLKLELVPDEEMPKMIIKHKEKYKEWFYGEV